MADGGLLTDDTSTAAPGPADGSGGDGGGFFTTELPGWIGKAGMVLAGGDPGLAHLSDQQKQGVGTRALLNMGLSMLMNSGPSYTPRNFGQILAAGMESAAQVPQTTEQAVMQQEMARGELGLKAAQLGISQGQLGISQYLAGLKGQELQIALAKLKAAQDMAAKLGPLLGGSSSSAGTGGAGAPTLGPLSSADLPNIIMARESGNNPNAQNPAGSAAGLGQFTDATWQDFVNSPANTGQWTMADRGNRDATTAAINWLGGQTDAAFQKGLNRPATPEEKLAGHMLGPGAAAAMAGAPDGDMSATLTGLMGAPAADKVFTGNAAVFKPGMTNAQGLKAASGFYLQPGAAPAQPASDASAILAGMDRASPGAGALVAGPGAPSPGYTPSASPAPQGPGYDPATGVRQRGTPNPTPGTGTAMPDMPNVALQALPEGVRQAYAVQLQAAAASGDPEKVAGVVHDMTQTAVDFAKTERWRTLAPAEARTELGPGYDPTVTYRANQFGKVEPIGPGIAPLNPVDTPEGQWTQTLNKMAGERLTKLGDEADKARQNLSQLDVVNALSTAAGSANPIGQMEVGGRKVVDWLNAAGVGSPDQTAKWTAQQALSAAIQKMSLDMRSGQGLGRLSNQELQYVAGSLPNPAQTPQTRNAMMAYIRDLYQRQVDYSTEVGNQLQLPGPDGKRKNITQAEADADRALGPTIKALPTLDALTNDPQYQGVREQAAQLNATLPPDKQTTPAAEWMKSNVRPGTFFKKPSGQLSIYPGQ